MPKPLPEIIDEVDEILEKLVDNVATQIDEGYAYDGLATELAKSELLALIDKEVRRGQLLELADLAKSFEDNKSYKGYMIKQIVSSRIKWVSKDGRVHIGAADLENIAELQQEEQK